jgi:tripartite-type tricarboxylate transporter receptor subunit TctC
MTHIHLVRRAALAMLLGAACVPLAQAQPAFPNKPVRILVGFPAGSGPDMVARLLAQKLTEAWGGAVVVVENKTGAGGLLAASETARAAPDGHTLMLGASTQLSIAPHTYKKLPYDPARDFIAVSQVVSSDFVLLVNPQKTPARNLKEFAAAVRQLPNGLFMGTFGAGTPGHFGAYMLGDAIQVKPEAVHYKNTGDVLTGLVSGDVQGVFGSAGFAVSAIQSGKVIAVATTGPTRSTALPEVPTAREQGVSGLEFTSWFGVVAPARTPADVVAKLGAELRKAVQGADARQKLAAAGFQVTGTSSEEFAQIIRRDAATWGKAVAATGFQAD